MKTICAILFSSALFFTSNASALEMLAHGHSDTSASFGASYGYNTATDIFTLDMPSIHPQFMLDGVMYDIFDTNASLTAVIDETGYLSSGNITWRGAVPTIPGINFDGDKIMEANVTSAKFGKFAECCLGMQFEFEVTSSNIDFGDIGVINLSGLWPGIYTDATPWESSYADWGPYTYTELFFHDVPEPTSLTLFGLGLAAMFIGLRKRVILGPVT